MPGRMGDAFERAAKQVAPRVGEIEPEDHAPRGGVEQRRQRAREIGQHHDAIGAGRRGFRLDVEKPDGFSRVHVPCHQPPQPVGERAGRRDAGHGGVLAGNSHGATHSRRSSTIAGVICTMKMVDPYIIIICPGSVTPTLTASAAAFMVPVITGVPTASPVASAAARVT